MPLPELLQLGIDRELQRVELQTEARARLARASAQLTENYKQSRFTQTLATPESRAAYLLTRLPATFAASLYVFREVARLIPQLAPHSLLDLGSGPGTAMWAAREIWPSLRDFALVESNREFQQLGARLASPIDNVKWIHADVNSAELPPADLVVLSYSLAEFKSPEKIIEKAWNAALKALVIVEPGTPRNFSLVAAVRAQLIESGAYLVAPCPHNNTCPMQQSDDWCHFAVRIERTSEHRQLKRGSLGYEDEKFSYLAFAKHPAHRAESRIVRHPAVHSGHIQLTLCTAEGLKKETVTRSNKENFRAARRTAWGEAWPPETV